MVQPDSVTLRWRKSARCEAQNCVEVARSGAGMAVRNNILPQEQLAFAGPAWQTFIDGLRANDFHAG